MMFLLQIPEETTRSTRPRPISESEYWERDVDKLQNCHCPTCGDYRLFRGLVYIGCRGCLNYFNEKEIIESNI